MIFNTWSYAVFLPVALLLYWLAPLRTRPWVLIALGFYFYRFYYPPHVWLIAGTIPAVLLLARRVAPGRPARAAWLAVGVTACLAGLAYYKYWNFVLETGADLAALVGLRVHVAPAVLRPPLGISFFVFEYVHYLVEVFRGSFAPARLRELTLFVMFFPTLICGPIKRFQQFHPEVPRRLTAADVDAGLRRILFGLAKKTLVADPIAPLCAPVFLHPERYDTPQLWLAVYGYALQIYFDFAGYSDIAIGTARLFGYVVPENFNWPYLQPNIARFWRAWHMSLTSWITDYVYIPLGGNRRGEWRAAGNRLVAMTLCGLWHGAALHFAAWGLYHGVMLNAYRGWTWMRGRVVGPRPPSLAGRVVGGVLTFHVVCVGWVLFVCELGQAAYITSRLVGLR